MRSPFSSLLASILTTSTSGGSSGKRALSSLVSLQEISIQAADGTILAAQRWTAKTASTLEENTTTKSNPDDKKNRFWSGDFDRTILCTHGWLDNCRTHYYLAPRLALELGGNTQVIAMDFPGHGWSSHRSKDAPPLVNADYAYYVCEAIRVLQSSSIDSEPSSDAMEEPEEFMTKWTDTALDTDDEDDPTELVKDKKKITLVGHSLGGGVASLTAASFPELVDQVVLLDAATFLPREAKDTAAHTRQHIQRRQESQQKPQSPPRIYPSLHKAIKVRQFSATNAPGNQALSYEAAREIVSRGTRKVESDQIEKGSECSDGDNTEDGGPVQYQHDPRFTWPSIQYMTWEQNEGVLAALGNSDVEACFIRAENGWPVHDYMMKSLVELLQPRVFKKMRGHHHLHADPETCEAVADVVIDFLKR